MPARIDAFVLERAKSALLRRFKTIRQADGYNTTPTVGIGARTLLKIPAGEFPAVAVEFGNLVPGADLLGGGVQTQGVFRKAWETFVWGYVASSGLPDDLYRSGLALLQDVYAVIYAQENLRDGNGQDTVLMVDAGEIDFDMESFSQENRGYFLARFSLIVDFERGGSP